MKYNALFKISLFFYVKVKQFYMYLWGKDRNITSVNVYNFQSVRIMRVFSPVIDVNFYSNKVSFFSPYLTG